MIPVLLICESNTVKPIFKNYEAIYVSISELNDIFKVLSSKNPAVLITVGNNVASHFNWMPFEWRKRWIHIEQISDLNENRIDYCYFGSFRHKLEADWPLVSAITSTWCSGDRLQRPWRSLKSQSYTNWEWIIWDDSPDSDHGATYAAALKLADQDPRVKVFKAPRHSGLIGQMKRLACGTASGSLLFELDHDDDLVPDCFQWLVDASKAHPECNFFYSDTMEVYEDHYAKRSYPDGFAFGHGSQMHFWHQGADCQDPAHRKGSWQVHMSVAPINDTTVTHLVGLPNHFRCWRRDFYWAIGGHSDLPVADDFDLLIRSLKCKRPVDASNWCHIMAPAYIQYVNSGHNNFTFKRNALIQHAVAWLGHMTQLHPIPSHTMPVYAIDGTAGTELSRHNVLYRPWDKPVGLMVLRPDDGLSTDQCLEAISAIVSKNSRGPLAIIEFSRERPRMETVCAAIVAKERIQWWSLQDTGQDHIAVAKRYAQLFYGMPLEIVV